MPTERNVQAIRVQRRVSICQRSPTRPVTSIPMANANGTVNPTNPRYRSGGWIATSGLSWSSALGPAPWAGGVPTTRWNGLDGPTISPMKNAETVNITSVAHATTGSRASRRKRHTTAHTKTERMNPHNRIDPASADHRPVIE